MIEKKLLILFIFLIVYLGFSAFSQTTLTQQKVPSNTLLDSQIINYVDKKIEITGECLSVDNVFGSGSMAPTFGENHSLIVDHCFNQSDIQIGDIICYDNNIDHSQSHRVFDIKEDSNGWYAVTKGDNSFWKDDYKVRLSDIDGIVMGVLY